MTLGKTFATALLAVAFLVGAASAAARPTRSRRNRTHVGGLARPDLKSVARLHGHASEEVQEAKDIDAHVVSSPTKIGDRLELGDAFTDDDSDAYLRFVRRLRSGERARLEHTVLSDETMMLKLTDRTGRGITQFDRIDKAGGKAVELGMFDVREYLVSKEQILRDGSTLKRLGPKWAAAYVSFARGLGPGEKVSLEVGTSKGGAHGKKMYVRVTRSSGASITQLSDLDPHGTIARRREVFETGPFDAAPAAPAPTTAPPSLTRS